MKRLSLKLVESIRYYYSSKKPVVKTVRIIQIIIVKTKGFAEESTSYIIFVNLKKEKEKDRAPTSIFGSFIRKLSKGKEYIPVKDPI